MADALAGACHERSAAGKIEEGKGHEITPEITIPA
jgi:hypothetical protein